MEPARYRRYAISYADDFGWKCVYCAVPLTPASLTADHVQARSKGGTDAYRNIRPACGRCNSHKSNHSVEVFQQRTGEPRTGRRRRLDRLPRVTVLNPHTGAFIPIGSQNVKHLTVSLMESGRYVFR